MPRMIVKDKALHYGGRSMKAGEQFDATDVDATYLRNRGKADNAPVETPRPPPRAEVKPAETPKAAVPKAAEPDEKKSTAVAPMSTTTAAAIAPAAGAYGRRDLKATE